MYVLFFLCLFLSLANRVKSPTKFGCLKNPPWLKSSRYKYDSIIVSIHVKKCPVPLLSVIAILHNKSMKIYIRLLLLSVPASSTHEKYDHIFQVLLMHKEDTTTKVAIIEAYSAEYISYIITDKLNSLVTHLQIYTCEVESGRVLTYTNMVTICILCIRERTLYGAEF